MSNEIRRSKDDALKRIRSVDNEKRKRLAELDLFVLDNSLRESVVGQTFGHTLENKLAILDAVASVGIEYRILGAFAISRRVDDQLALILKERGEVMSKYFVFTEDADNCNDQGCMLFGLEKIPAAMLKMKEFGVPNPIIEVDLDDASISWDSSFPVERLLELISFLLEYARDELGCDRRALINVRDWPFVMIHHPERLLQFVRGIVALPAGPGGIRPMGLMVEEPTGLFFASECAHWTRWLRDDCMTGWEDAKLLTRVHKQWGMADAVVLDMLASGADGIWCSLAEEGAAMGHTCSSVTLANLARLGNKKICRKFNTKNLVKAAVEVTKQTAGRAPDPRQTVYGPRATEVVFDFAGIAGSSHFDGNGDGIVDEVDSFSLAHFLGLPKPPIRITSLASNNMIMQHLCETFVEDPQFTEELATKMKERMQADLDDGRREDYSTPTGLAHLCIECGVKLDELEVRRATEADLTLSPFGKKLLTDAEEMFLEIMAGEPSMDKFAFYHYFLQPYLGCFACDTSRVMIETIIDVNHDGTIEWEEWKFWLVWALRQSSSGDDILTLDDLHHRVFRDALLPATLANLDEPEHLSTGADVQLDPFASHKFVGKTLTAMNCK